MPTFRGATFEIEDVDGDFKRLFADRALSKKVQSFLGTAVLITTAKIYQRVLDGVPVDTGDLKDSIDLWTSRRGLLGKAGIIRDDVDQAHAGLANEYGTEHMRQIRPFLVPAAEAETPHFAQRAADMLRQVERLLSKGY